MNPLRPLPALLVLLALLSIPAHALERWIYCSQNLWVDKNIEALDTLLRRAAKAGYTHVLLSDSKFAKLGDMDARYFRNLDRVKQLAAELKLEIIPALFPIGYSNDILWHDPNLIEAMPVQDALFVVRNGVAKLEPDPRPVLKGGDFANLKQWDWKDNNVVADNGAARMTDPNGANARIVQKLRLRPFRQYHLSVRVKTQDFRGRPEAKVLAGNQALDYDYHAVTVHDDQAMICPSEPRTIELLRDQARRMHAAWGAKGYMMSHDEIRVLNWCEACQRRGLDAGALLADNVRSCVNILREVNPGGRIYVWSDMFDPHHNARKDYYHVRGDLAGSWEVLDKKVIVVPWYFEKRAESLSFFAGRGHRQLIAGYYDARPERVRDWLDAAKEIPGVTGVMYTTWEHKFADLERFAELIGPAGRQP